MPGPIQGTSREFQIGELREARSDNQVFAREVARGLRSVLAQKNAGVPQFGTRYAPVDGSGQVVGKVGGYRVMGDKAKGVEPGFIAKRDWLPSDDAKLAAPGHRFHQQAQDRVANWISRSVKDPHGLPSKGQVHELLDSMLDDLGHDAASPLGQLVEKLKKDRDPMIGMNRVANPDAEGVANLADMLVTYLARHPSTERDSLVAGAATMLREGVMANDAKFQKLHYVKLDYYEADRFGKSYMIPIDRAKGDNFLEKNAHRGATAAKPLNHNKGAVREALANDLMRLLGVPSQKLKIVEGAYEDGKTTKLLLDSTHVEGFSDFDGKPERGERYLKDGVLVRNTRNPDDPPGRFSGPAQVDRGMQELGRNKILMLLMADRDALGSKGGNKGAVDNRLVGIDPGHALEEELLSRRGDIRSDFSFSQPSHFDKFGYKNYSMFDQSSLAEKLEGVRQIQTLKDSGADTRLFDTYARSFSDPTKPEVNLAAGITRMQTLYERRRDDILDIFAGRLAVDTFALGADRGSAQHMRVRDDTLNLLDAIEKLTSRTVGETETGIKLDYLQIANAKDRKEWDVIQERSGDISFTFNGRAREVKSMQKSFNEFQSTLGPDAPRLVCSPDNRELKVTVPVDRIGQTAQMFGYGALMQHKHGHTPPIVAEARPPSAVSHNWQEVRPQVARMPGFEKGENDG